jgi:hypothetical protein
MGALMQSNKPEGTLLVTVGTQGVCVFAWEGLTDSEIEDVLEVIHEFVAFKRPNSFIRDGERTGRRITVQVISTKSALNQGE